MAIKKCIDCETRPVDRNHPDLQLCVPCREYAEAENRHSDDAHDDPEGSHSTDLANEMDSCPVCNPELDPRPEHRPHSGASRKGMVITAKGTAKDKAETFKNAVGDRGTVKILTRKGITTAKAALSDGRIFELVWEEARWTPASRMFSEAKAEPRKIRNLAEALRLLS